MTLNSCLLNIELGVVVRRARGEDDSYFYRVILHTDVAPVIPRHFVPLKCSGSISVKAGKDADCERHAPNPHALLEANADQLCRPQGTYNTLTLPKRHIHPLIFVFVPVPPQLRRNT